MRISYGLSKKEITCSCGCGFSGCTLPTLIGWTRLRLFLNIPLKVSGPRCAERNKAVFGSPTSRHMMLDALDITVPKGYTVQSFANICKVFFNRVLIGYKHPVTKKWVNYANHVHCDSKGIEYNKDDFEKLIN